MSLPLAFWEAADADRTQARGTRISNQEMRFAVAPLIMASAITCQSANAFVASRGEGPTRLSTNVKVSQSTEIETSDNPLRSAGKSFISASGKSLGMLFYNVGGLDHKEIQALLLQAGTCLVDAGERWHDDWDGVRDFTYDASKAFARIANTFGSASIDESMELAMSFEKIAEELLMISEISGCSSVGPPCSAPHLLTIEEELVAISKILRLNSVAATDDHMMSTLFREVAELFGELASRYTDTDETIQGEVSL